MAATTAAAAPYTRGGGGGAVGRGTAPGPWPVVDARGRGLRDGEKVPEGAPAELLPAEADQLDEAGCGGLGVGQGVVRTAVPDVELVAHALETDGVAQVPERPRHAAGVEVVGVDRGLHGAGDQPGVERVGAVFDEDRSPAEAAEPVQHALHGRRATEALRADAVDALRIGVDAVGAVHQRFERHDVPVKCEGHRAELHEPVWRLAGGLAVQGDEAQLLYLCLWSGTVQRRPVGVCRVVVDGRERLDARRTEPRHETVADRHQAAPPAVPRPAATALFRARVGALAVPR